MVTNYNDFTTILPTTVERLLLEVNLERLQHEGNLLADGQNHPTTDLCKWKTRFKDFGRHSLSLLSLTFVVKYLTKLFQANLHSCKKMGIAEKPVLTHIRLKYLC